MDSKKRSFLLVLLAVMGIRMGVLAQTLHLIAFCDTDDSRIGQATEVSYKYFAREFKELITNAAEMSVKTYFYKGSAFTLPNLDALLNTLSVGQDDAILFWYDGHGFNNQDGDFPTLTLPNLQNVRNLQSISTSLRNKGARLTCVFANSCNKERTTRSNIVGTFIAQNAPDAYAPERIRLLFKSARGSLIATSSKRGQASQNTPSGAWYFLGFRGALDEILSNQYTGKVDWNALMTSISQKTEKIGEDNGFTQNPHYISTVTREPIAQIVFTDFDASRIVPITPTVQSTSFPAKNDFTESVSGVSFGMKYIAGTSFQMGSNKSEDEKPIHTVRMGNFHMSQYEVTFAEYDKFCDATEQTKPSDNGWGRGNRPVINVSWHDAVAYCQWLSNITNKTYRLPTEAEWEFSARGGESYKYAGGNDVDNIGWYEGNSNSKPHPVGQKQANAFGLYDMAGNVLEWCSDLYNSSYDIVATGTNRVLRGGSWYDSLGSCRVAYRRSSSPMNRSADIGFRVVCIR